MQSIHVYRYKYALVRFWSVVAALFLLVTSIFADENTDVKGAFMKWNIALYDMPKPYGFPLPNVDWRFVEANDEISALVNPVFLVHGITNEKGEVILNKQARQKLFDVWEKLHEGLWFVYSANAFQVLTEKKGQTIELALVKPEPEYAKKQRLAEEEAAKNRKISLSPSIYTQQGFNAKKFANEYADWKNRFSKDLNEMQKYINKNIQNNSQVKDTASSDIENFFQNSIHNGKKGHSFKKMMFEDYAIRRQTTDGTVVLPNGVVFEKLALSKFAKPIGFGGEFTDELNNSVELWYMTFDDMSDWSVQDFKESAVFSTFKSPQLPTYNTLERDRWPALVFIRDDNGRLMLYAMSREISVILGNIFNRSLF